MARLKRLLIWLTESTCEAITTGALLIALAHSQFRGENLKDGGFVHDALVMSVAVAMMFLVTGYLLTTIIGRLVVNPERRLLYPSIASALYFIHFEVLSVSIGGAFDPWERWVIRGVGPCIAFLCTLGGNHLLSNWKSSAPTAIPA